MLETTKNKAHQAEGIMMYPRKEGLKCPNPNCPSNATGSHEEVSLGFTMVGGPAEMDTAFVVWYCERCNTIISITAAKQR
ncbi:MAG: hypothetical protein JEY71_11815 [Sphaerochaeta sp.]|nr:hypothetical protein [Sphaerochaeta sp.]